MKIHWVRGNDKINFNKAYRWFCLGIIDSAKSSFLEKIGEQYLNAGQTVLDLYGSRDGEGLAWCRSSWAKDKRILLLHGDNVDVSGSFDLKNVSKLSLTDLDNYDIIISATPLYTSPHQEFREVNRVLDLLYKRQYWKRLVYGICREAGNLFYSRIRVSKDQFQAKAEAVYLVRESRHMGLALGLDSLRFYSVDIDLRSIVDFEVIKSLGLFGLPDDLDWLYHIISPVFIRKMPKSAFVILSKTGAIGLGSFPKVPWHKEEGEHIARSIGLKIEYGEEPELGEDRHTFKTIGDAEHAEIIALYVDDLQSMHKIAEQKNRSTATIQTQIKRHNLAIRRSGFCPMCRRVRGKNDSMTTLESSVQAMVQK